MPRKMFQQSMDAGKERHQALVQEKAVLTKELDPLDESDVPGYGLVKEQWQHLPTNWPQ